ncbi:unnamed protein product, partial [Rotaria magnacalcarata]
MFFSCDIICSKLINADGNWKFGRHICMDKTKVRTTAEFDSVIVGCDKTPKPGVDSCDEHRDRRHVSIMSEDEDCIDND